ncbi:DUF2461 family protein [Actinopolymorpha sp. B17G11]|uniref:DUF2461 family protein n=1 Tax=unclassified Actinopolymorpha TaxID=2627063 RepID=UPI0032D8DC2C
MGRRFTGWPEEAFDVLLRLEGDPAVVVRERHRKDRDRLVREPMIALLQDLADIEPVYDDFSVWGYGSHPWPWQHQSGVIRLEGRMELGMRFDLDGLGIHGGWVMARPGQAELFRAAVADDASGKELTDIVEVLREQGFEVSGDVMKRTPRGYPADHPRAGLLRHRTLVAARELGCDEWLHTPEVLERVREVYDGMRPLTAWLATHVGR